MERKIETNVKDHKEKSRAQAIQFVKKASEDSLKNYIEPKRTGTPKGDPIGFSRKKYHTAHLTVLHPHCLKLKEIAKIAGTSEGLIRVWRTEENFLKVAQEFGNLLAEKIAGNIKNAVRKLEIEDHEDKAKPGFDDIRLTEIIQKLSYINDPVYYSLSLISTIPFFNRSVTEPFLIWLKEKAFSDDISYIAKQVYLYLSLHLYKEAFVDDGKSLREYSTRPEVLEHIKFIIKDSIDSLVNLAIKDEESWKDTKKSDVEEFGKNLKTLIIDELDILAQ